MELVQFDFRFAGDLAEVEVWHRTKRPVEFSFHFSNTAYSQQTTLREFQEALEVLTIRLYTFSDDEIYSLARLGNTNVFKEKKTADQIRQRMINLLADKEIDIVSENADGTLRFLEVKNYGAPINNIDSTQFSKKSISTQLKEVEWIIKATGFSDKIDLGIIFSREGIHPREAKRLLNKSVKVFTVQ
jgi:hypothetical protein